MLGTISTFAFTMISSMILSRYLNKADYGSYKQVLYIYNSLAIIFVLGVPKAFSFFLPRVPKEQQRNTANRISSILFLAGAIMSLCLYFGADLIASLLKNKSLAELLRIFSITPFLMLPTFGIEGTLSSLKKAHLIALYHFFSRSILLSAVIVPIIFFNGSVKDVVIGFVIGSTFSLFIALIFKSYAFRYLGNQSTSVSYRELFNYSLPIFFAGLWGIIINSSDQYFISRFYGTTDFAEFVNGWIDLPFVTMIVASSSVILAPIYSKQAASVDAEKAREQIITIWHSVISKTIKITYPLLLFCFVFSKEIMILLFGIEYAESAVFFEVKVIASFFIVIAYGPLVLSIGGNRYYFKTHMYGALLLLPLQGLAVIIFDSAVAIVWVSVICLLGRIIAMLKYVANYLSLEVSELIPARTILKIIPAIFIVYITKLMSFHLDINIGPTLILAFVIYIISFLIWAKIVRLDYTSIISPFIGKAWATNVKKNN